MKVILTQGRKGSPCRWYWNFKLAGAWVLFPFANGYTTKWSCKRGFARWTLRAHEDLTEALFRAEYEEG